MRLRTYGDRSRCGAVSRRSVTRGRAFLRARALLGWAPLVVPALNRKTSATSVAPRSPVLGSHCHCCTAVLQAIAAIVGDHLGGPFPSEAEPEMRQRWAADSARVKRDCDRVIVPVAALHAGLGVHRALLFKFLADASNVPCALVGSPCQGAHLQWNRKRKRRV